jgi:hypothetical protein
MGDRSNRHKFTRKKNSIRLPKTIKTVKYVEIPQKRQSRFVKFNKREKYNNLTRYCSTDLCKLQRQQSIHGQKRQVGGRSTGEIIQSVGEAVGVISKKYEPVMTIMQKMEKNPKSKPCDIAGYTEWQEYDAKLSLSDYIEQSLIHTGFYEFSAPTSGLIENRDSSDIDYFKVDEGVELRIIMIDTTSVPNAVDNLKRIILSKSFPDNMLKNVDTAFSNWCSNGGYYAEVSSPSPSSSQLTGPGGYSTGVYSIAGGVGGGGVSGGGVSGGGVSGGGGGTRAEMTRDEFDEKIRNKTDVKQWISCPSDAWKILYDPIQREIKSTAYILRAFTKSYITTAVNTTNTPPIWFQFTGTVFDILYNITGEWSKDSQFFRLNLTSVMRSTPRLIIAAGPSSAGKTFTGKNIISLLSTDPEFPNTFLTIDGGLYREMSYIYQLIIKYLEKYTNLAGFTNLVDPGGPITGTKKTLGSAVSLFDSDIIKRIATNYLLSITDTSDPESKNKKISLYVPETFGFCGSLDCSNKYEKYIEISGDDVGWSCILFWQHKYGYWTDETLLAHINAKDSSGKLKMSQPEIDIWTNNASEWISKHDCDFPDGYRCAGVIESGTLREQREGKKYSSGSWSNAMTNGRIVMHSAPGFALEFHNTGGLQGSMSTITDYSSVNIQSKYSALFTPIQIVDKTYNIIYVDGNAIAIYTLPNNPLNNQLQIWKPDEDSNNFVFSNNAQFKCDNINKNTYLLATHQSRMRCFLDTFLYESGVPLNPDRVDPRFQNGAILKMSIRNCNNQLVVRIFLVYSGELDKKEQSKINPSRPYYIRENDLTEYLKREAGNRAKNKKKSSESDDDAYERGYNNSYKVFPSYTKECIIKDDDSGKLTNDASELLKKLKLLVSDIPDNTEYNFYEVRHGQGTHNLVKMVNVNYDTPVTDVGIQQAKNAGEQLYQILQFFGETISLFFASDLDRTRTTLMYMYYGMYRQWLDGTNSKYKFLVDTLWPASSSTALPTAVQIIILPCSSELPYKTANCDVDIARGSPENYSKCTVDMINDAGSSCNRIAARMSDDTNVTFNLNWNMYLTFYDNSVRSGAVYRSTSHSIVDCRNTNMISMAFYIINGQSTNLNNYIQARIDAYVSLLSSSLTSSTASSSLSPTQPVSSYLVPAAAGGGGNIVGASASPLSSGSIKPESLKVGDCISLTTTWGNISAAKVTQIEPAKFIMWNEVTNMWSPTEHRFLDSYTNLKMVACPDNDSDNVPL